MKDFVLFVLLASASFFGPYTPPTNHLHTNHHTVAFVAAQASQCGGARVKVADLWLNFSLADAHGSPFANIGFQFYVSNTGDNCTDYYEGFANTPIRIENREVDYVFFSNVSALFQSYVYWNGTQVLSGISFAGPPWYGPPGYRYARVGLDCGFPCLRDGVYAEQNITGRMVDEANRPYRAWSYWFQASNLTVVTFHHGNLTLPTLHIVVNVSVSMLHNNSSDWLISPQVEVAGARYSVANLDGGVVYTVYTGLDLSGPQHLPLRIGVAAALLVCVGAASYYLLRHRRVGSSLSSDSGTAGPKAAAPTTKHAPKNCSVNPPSVLGVSASLAK